MKKSDREIMEILEAFDATGVPHSAAALCNADPKTVRRYVQARDLGRPVAGPVLRPRLIDPFLEKIEEWVDRSKGKIRADVAPASTPTRPSVATNESTPYSLASKYTNATSRPGATPRPFGPVGGVSAGGLGARVLRAEDLFPCFIYSLVEISGCGVTPARSEVVGNSSRSRAVFREGLRGVRQ